MSEDFKPACRGDWFPTVRETKVVAVTKDEAMVIRLALIYYNANVMHAARLLEDGVDIRELQRKFRE